MHESIPIPEAIAKVAEVIPEVPKALAKIEADARQDRKAGTSKTINYGWIQTIVGIISVAAMFIGAWNRAEVRDEVTSTEVRNLQAEVTEVKTSLKELQRDQKETFRQMWEEIHPRAASMSHTAFGPMVDESK